MRLPWGMRWWELVPEVLLAVGLGLFFVMETAAATSAFASKTAITLMVLVGAGWLCARVLLARYGRWPLLRLIVFAVLALGVLRVVVLPAYDDTTVVEKLPVAAAEPANAPMATPDAAPTPTPAPSGPVALRSSAIHGIDHRASGTAVIYQQSDGSLVVGLEEIDIQPGPDYDVFVVPGADRDDTDGGIRLDDLRGNKGTQYYSVGADADVSTGAWTVLVWCETFDVPVASATPA